MVSIEKLREYAQIFKELGDAFQALRGRKPLSQKVAVLSNPDNPKAMSILTKPQARFVANAYYSATVEEWGNLFEGLKMYADEVMDTSGSVDGKRSEQVIGFVGAMGGQKLLEKMRGTFALREEKEQ